LINEDKGNKPKDVKPEVIIAQMPLKRLVDKSIIDEEANV
jgi:hypothetical protein